MIWALRHYTLPLFMALAVHLAVVATMFLNWQPSVTKTRTIKPPQIINSELIILEATAKPAPPKPMKPKPMLNQAPPAKVEPKPVPKKTDKPVEPKKVEKIDDTAELIKKQEAEARARRLQALNDQAFTEALEMETSDLASQAADDAAVQAAASYRMGIYQAIVANWSRPPSARTGMEAELLVELVPTGDIVSVRVIESSGNPAFDRSAQAAVQKARNFEVPKESAVFERHFRTFTLLFKPEDLIR